MSRWKKNPANSTRHLLTGLKTDHGLFPGSHLVLIVWPRCYNNPQHQPCIIGILPFIT